jgi:AbrB family looped-hinge helix DNA binding protein
MVKIKEIGMLKVRVSKRGQITIPSQIRQQTGIKEGDWLAVMIQDQQIIIRPMTKTLLGLRGSIMTTEPQDFAAIRRGVIASGSHETAKDGR